MTEPQKPSYDPRKVDLATVCLKSVLLGVIISITLNNIYFKVWVQPNVYILSIAVFHLAEFLSISLFNITQIDDDSFILTDYELLTINILTVGEYLLYELIQIPQSLLLRNLGLFLMLLGQTFRTLAIATAKESFNHYIQRTKRSNHQLITHGVFKYIRHPSYFGFFWWFVGLRLYLNNWILLICGAYKLHLFFKQRIEFEESFLVNFFGDDYIQYQKRSYVAIPFI